MFPMSQDWRNLFGTIDVSASGIRGTGARVLPAAPPTPQPVVTQNASALAAPPPKVTIVRPPASPTNAAPQTNAQPAAENNQAATQYPGVWTMAQTFTASAAQFVAGGLKTVSRDVREQRLSICKMCPQYDGTRCIQCGCFIAAKTWVPHEKCPAGKWPD